MPDAGPEQAPGTSPLPLSSPKPPSFAHDPCIDDAAGDQKALVGNPEPPQARADGEEQDRVSKGYAAVHSRVGPCQHSMSSVLVLLSNGPAQAIEVRELPRIE